MFNYRQVAQQFHEEGYVVVPKLFEEERVYKIKSICERVLSYYPQRKANKKT